MPYRSGRHFLQIPGPTNVPDRILRAMARPTIDHRGPEFRTLTREVLDGLRAVFKTRQPVVIYPASGTGAWESALVNTLSPGDRVLMVETGHFATLWREIAARHRNTYLVALLGGEAGLRCGEMMALERADVNLRQGQLCVRRSEWRGHVTTPRGGRIRYVPMTKRLSEALRHHRHLRRPRVLVERDGRSFTQKWCRTACGGRPNAPGWSTTGFISYGTRSVRTWLCAGLPFVPFRSWRDIRTCRRHNGTCT